MSNNNQNHDMTDEQVEQIMFDAMRMHGMLPPSVEEVATLDAELTSIVLPFSPLSPDELFKRLDAVNSSGVEVTSPFVQHPDAQYTRNLAHAAREGSELTREIVQRMEADKERFLRDKTNDQ
jgi:hypothetical protein